ncbi:MAG: ribonuclease H-like domain-containing protein [Hungatella sp.]
MITVEKTIHLPDTYPLDRLGPLDQLLFFDIETTGFSGDYSQLYLIGCTYYQNDQWNLIQWFADTAAAEPELLHAFFSFMDHFSILVHFNGDGFDIPYLLKRRHALGLPYDFSRITSLDIYKKIKPYRRLLHLETLKQKSLERFLGIYRQDQYSGGQLIEIYQDYLVTRQAALYDMLMLHNAEDLQGMPLILPILNYPDFFEHSLVLKKRTISQKTPAADVPWPITSGSSVPILELVFQSPYRIPVPFEQKNQFLHCLAHENELIFAIPLYEGELKYFYPNYKDYYYMPLEDTAIHKSVGEYVEKDARIRATARTCYTKKQGCFLPQFKPLWEPSLQMEYKDKITFAEYRDSLFAQDDNIQSYLHQLLSSFL